MSNNGAKITNPIAASQIWDVRLDWQCLETPVCSGLIDSMQNLVDALCSVSEIEISDLELECLEIEDKKLGTILVGLVAQVCKNSEAVGTIEDEGSVTTFSEDEKEILDVWVNLCTEITLNTSDGFAGLESDDCEIEVTNPCGPKATTQEIIQALFDRVNAQSCVIKELIAEIEQLKNTIKQNTTDIEQNKCCDEG